jgi:hypothetical protein
MLSAGPGRPFVYGKTGGIPVATAKYGGSPVNVLPLAPDEPLSPELVLVLPPELRAQVVAGLPAPVWAIPRLRVVSASPSVVAEPVTRPLGRVVVSRARQLALVFVAITLVTLAMSLVAHAVR